MGLEPVISRRQKIVVYMLLHMLPNSFSCKKAALSYFDAAGIVCCFKACNADAAGMYV